MMMADNQMHGEQKRKDFFNQLHRQRPRLG